MAYTTNPRMAKVRRDAVRLVQYRGWSTRQVSRYTGFSQSAVVKWCERDPTGGWHEIPTRSSKPKRHPKQLSDALVQKIVNTRLLLNRSAEVVHRALAEEGVSVSLSSVKRTLDRQGLLKKRSPWKRYHTPSPRPYVAQPGDLVQADTIHLAVHGKTELYVFTLIDLHSRWAYAWCSQRANARTGLLFVKRAQVAAPFLFRCIQTDNGSEWSTHFTERVKIRHRHSRVRQSNDNAHVERFNRTLREELLDGLPVDPAAINRALPQYLKHYNEERHHFGISLQKPIQLLAK